MSYAMVVYSVPLGYLRELLGGGDRTVLADALEDAGCTAEVFLGHCRWDGKHHPSCWLAPKILGS